VIVTMEYVVTLAPSISANDTRTGKLDDPHGKDLKAVPCDS